MRMMDRDLETMNERERSKNSKKLNSILNAFMKDPSFEREKMEIKGISKVRYLDLDGTGMLYLVSIRVRNLESRKMSTIEKMVWEGTSMEVLDIQILEKKEVDSICMETSTTVRDYKKYKDLVKLVMFEAATTLSFKFTRVHHVEEIVEQRMYNPKSGFNFKVYSLVFEGVLHHEFAECGVHVVIEADVLRRDWLQIMDDKKAADFCAWLKDPIPPSPKPVEKFHIHPFDLSSPQVLTQAWLVLEDHKFKKGEDLEFVKVLNGKSLPTAGRNYFLTFQVKDSASNIRTFHIATLEAGSLKCWKPVSPLVPGKEDDGVRELYDVRLESKRININIKRPRPKEEAEVENLNIRQRIQACHASPADS